MNTSISITIDKRTKKKDGTYPLVLLLVHNGSPQRISLNLSILEKDWDEKRNKVKNSYSGVESVVRLNNLLEKKKAEKLEIIMKLEEKKELHKLSAIDLKKLLVNQNVKEITLFAYTQQVINELIVQEKVGNARTYKSLLTGMKLFLKERDIPLREITYNFLVKFEREYLSRGNSLNGLSVYMRTLRALINKAIKERILGKEDYPFDEYQIKSKETAKRALSVDLIKRIVSLELPSNDPLFHTRNFFLISFYLNGISFIDMAFLKWENIIDGRMKYLRRKTHKPYDIKISENLQLLLENYRNQNTQKIDYIFPIIKRTSLIEQYCDIEWSRKRYNKKLKKIASLCSIDENLTSYVSRHSFATILKQHDVPISAISEMLGHKDLKTTQIYLDSLSSDRLDTYTDIISNL